MQTEMTANRVSSMGTGIMFFSAFGAAWLFWSMAIREEVSAVTASAAFAGVLALIAGAVYLKRRAKQWPRVPDDPREGRLFGWVNAIEWAAIFAAGFVCHRFHWDLYFPSAVTVIVGLHFYPLAGLFRNPLHYGTGTALVVWAVASAATVSADHLQGITTRGTGAILWAASLVTFVRGLTLMSRFPVSASKSVII